VLLAAIPLGLLIGLVVGTVGGGGAILALPVFVYVLGQGVGQASTASLIVVALAAGLGAGALAWRGHVCWRIAGAFSVPAVAAAVAGTAAGSAVAPRTLILSFVPVMLVAAASTWLRSDAEPSGGQDGCPQARMRTVVLAGGIVGLLTGFFGVGGGFLIVPALTLALGLVMRRAVATSLVIITVTALAALASHLASGVELDVPITVALAAATGVGTIAGTIVGGRLPNRVLARGFALVVTALALFLLTDVLVLGGPPTA
jgi:uncharacterized protein